MTDAVIIGGGIAGLSLGAALAPYMDVTVLEAEEAVGYHTSGRSAALYAETYGKPSTIALNRASRADFETLDGGLLSPRGLMLLGRDDDEVFRSDFDAMGMEDISVEEAKARVPILDRGKLARVGLREDAHDIDTDRLLQLHVKTIRANGGEVRLSSRVRALDWADGRWRVTCDAREIEARLLINASGAWADHLAAMAGVATLGLQPLRRSMARLAAPGGHDLRAWPMLFGPGESWYAKPDAGALLVSPADEDPSEPMDAWPDDLVLAEGLARYEEAVTEPVTRPISTWAGLRTMSPDRGLVLGFAPDHPSFFWCAGQGGYGFQTSPAAARFAADVILGRASELDAEIQALLTPARFA